MESAKPKRLAVAIRSAVGALAVIALGFILDALPMRPALWWIVFIACLIWLTGQWWVPWWVRTKWRWRATALLGLAILMSVVALLPSGGQVPSLPAHRPDIHLLVDEIEVDLKQNAIFLAVTNEGDRVASEVRVRFEPDPMSDRMAHVWPLYELAPSEIQDALFYLQFVDPHSGPVLLSEWSDADGHFHLKISACTVYDGLDMFSAAYYLDCDPKGRCNYQPAAQPADYDCFEQDDAVLHYYKGPVFGRVVPPTPPAADQSPKRSP